MFRHKTNHIQFRKVSGELFVFWRISIELAPSIYSCFISMLVDTCINLHQAVSALVKFKRFDLLIFIQTEIHSAILFPFNQIIIWCHQQV